MKKEKYGKELIINLHECNPITFSRRKLERFFEKFCDLIDMERADLHFWDYEGEEDLYDAAPAHLKGTYAIQFIMTSNITIHTLDELKKVYINIFSCKDFDSEKAISFCANYFNGKLEKSTILERV